MGAEAAEEREGHEAPLHERVGAWVKVLFAIFAAAGIGGGVAWQSGLPQPQNPPGASSTAPAVERDELSKAEADEVRKIVRDELRGIEDDVHEMKAQVGVVNVNLMRLLGRYGIEPAREGDQ